MPSLPGVACNRGQDALAPGSGKIHLYSKAEVEAWRISAFIIHPFAFNLAFHSPPRRIPSSLPTSSAAYSSWMFSLTSSVPT